MSKPYEPELGQMCFGTPWNAIDLDIEFPDAEYFLCVLASLTGAESTTYADNFQNDTFEMHPYWWGDEDAPEAERTNFKCGDVEIRWYKYIGRGMTTNTYQDEDAWKAMFAKCIWSLKEDSDADEAR